MQQRIFVKELKLNVKVGVEAPRSNGRIERVIGTIREALQKDKKGIIEEKLERIKIKYNNTYYKPIKYTLNEAMDNYKSYDLSERNTDINKWKKRKCSIESYKVGQKVRVAQNDNVNKNGNLRFLRKGVIIEC